MMNIKQCRVWKMAILWALSAVAMPLMSAPPSEKGDVVVVVYNAKMPESKVVASHYARRREVPTNQVFGLDLPVGEIMTRAEYNEQLQGPLLKALKDQKLLVYGEGDAGKTAAGLKLPIAARIRYAVLCYGVPLKIHDDMLLMEEGMDKVQPQLKRNDAAVDSELACLPVADSHYSLTGPIGNPGYGATNTALLSPTNGILLVARLDGPTMEIARGLVDKAMEAETNGLWGRAYFDMRSITNKEYVLGDEWIGGAAEMARLLGFETVVDKNPETFPSTFPMSHIAFYAGWYDGAVSGPFMRTNVEFVPGAFAYHLHSSSAVSIRTASQYWVGPLLAKGATLSMGSVAEPYLSGTPDIRTFFWRLTFFGFSYGEAAHASQNVLSWQTTVVGDPLFRPYTKALDTWEFELQQRRSPHIEWVYLQLVNLNLAAKKPVSIGIEMLNKMIAAQRNSSILMEKLADLYWAQKKYYDAFDTWEDALKKECSPQQRARILLTYGKNLVSMGRDKKAYEVYQDFLKTWPDYPDKRGMSKQLSALAQKLGLKSEAEKWLLESQ